MSPDQWQAGWEDLMRLAAQHGSIGACTNTRSVPEWLWNEISSYPPRPQGNEAD